ncbi:MAG TPA: pantetheine-phosphate adenylyltransferase [Candidatus Hydrogenedentes bacterium]|nr:pantetheine-phosphate adenylyltransferase [Candidatus Hydrogenedentota bacterium]
MPEHIAIYPGSFDPPTLGHLDLIQRAAKLFHKVIVAVAHNDQKNALFSFEERAEMLKELVADIPNAEVDHFQGLTVDFARKHHAVAILRGLRAVSDFEYEFSLSVNNRKLHEELDTVCLMSSEPYLFLSSRMVKEIASYGGKISHFVTPAVERRIREKFAKNC